MKAKHVTDEQIQLFVFDRTYCEKEVVDHILSCNECIGEVKGYEIMSDALSKQSDHQFDFNLEQLVLEQLPMKEEKWKMLDQLMVGSITIGLSVMAGAIYYLVIVLQDFLSTINASVVYFLLGAAVMIFTSIGLDLYFSFHKKSQVVKFS